MIEVQNLVKVYGKHLAVDHLSFKVERGKIYGFLGPNGAGKSTTMNIMTGYLGATEGKVLINGHDILREPEQAKRSIGYLPESAALISGDDCGRISLFCGRVKENSQKRQAGADSEGA